MTRDTRSAYRARAASVERTIDEALLAEKNRQAIAYKVAKDMREAQESARRKFTRDELLGAVAVKDAFGWHKVVRVNATTITVESGYSWNNYVEYDHVLAFREATK